MAFKMANKKSSRKRNAGRRGGRPGCLSRLLFFLFLAIAMVAAIVVFFKINRINVEGAERYTSSEIRENSGVSVGDNLVFLNKIAVTRKIFSKLPYVDEIKISRKLPDTLIISVTEAKEFAFVENEGSIWYIDKKGKLLEKAAARRDELIEVTGVVLIRPVAGENVKFGDTDTGKIKTMTDFFSAITTNNIPGITRVDLSQVYDIEFEYLGRFTVKFGAPEAIDYKLAFLGEIVGELELGDKGTIDLSELMETEEARFIPYN
jgi:cell division protein FtsQ